MDTYMNSNLDINPLTVSEVISRLPLKHTIVKSPLEKPEYKLLANDCRLKLGLAVKSMETHTSDEGYQIFQGLEHNGYILAGHGLQINLVDINKILNTFYPGIVVLQDKREWEGRTANQSRAFKFNTQEKFLNVISLRQKDDIFKLTILKDAHQENGYHAESANEIGCHAWIIYYNPLIVNHLAPFTRFNNLIRTYHTINRDIVPNFLPGNKREGCLLSGAISGAYPLRSRLVKELANLENTTYYPHPGYVRNKCYTPEFMKLLSNYKVAICTASLYGYSSRKIFEATACGCVVLTDLPIDDKIPHIDENLVRIHPDTSIKDIRNLTQELIHTYNEEKQRHFAAICQEQYDYRVITNKLADDIENIRISYNS